MKTKKLPVLVALLGLVGVSLISLLPKSNYRTATIEKGKVKITALIADSPQKRALGLGGRSSLGTNEGMIFYFEQSGYPGIWMRGMKFPIDIIWIAANKIVDIAPNVPPPSLNTKELPIYTPREKSNQVLEINAGLSQQLNLKIGDKIKIY